MLMNSPRAYGAPRAFPKALRALRGPLRCHSGATSIEYGLIAAGVGPVTEQGLGGRRRLGEGGS